MEVVAACHVHSTWSYDGSWTLEALSAKFSHSGCRVLMMTEHDRGFSNDRLAEFRTACANVTNEKILVVPGIEYSDAANRIHVLVWGKIPFLGEGLPTLEMLKAATDSGGLAVLAHPTRKEAWRAVDPTWRQYLLGIEVWNRKYDGLAPSRTAPALLESTAALPFVGLDFHTQKQSFPLRMAMEIEGDISEESVLACLRSRRCTPRAFGHSLADGVMRTASPALRLAERARKAVALAARRSKLLK
jgi:predicted metal-dependent phosphoesterase TrpH